MVKGNCHWGCCEHCCWATYTPKSLAAVCFFWTFSRISSICALNNPVPSNGSSSIQAHGQCLKTESAAPKCTKVAHRREADLPPNLAMGSGALPTPKKPTDAEGLTWLHQSFFRGQGGQYQSVFSMEDDDALSSMPTASMYTLSDQMVLNHSPMLMPDSNRWMPQYSNSWGRLPNCNSAVQHASLSPCQMASR